MKSEAAKLQQSINEAKRMGDFIGYHCEAPTLSVIDGNYSLIPTLLFNAPRCYSKAQGIKKIAERNPNMQAPLGNVFEAASTVGACRFWHNKMQPMPKECANAAELLKKAEAECFKKFANI